MSGLNDAITCAYLNVRRTMKKIGRKVHDRFEEFKNDESGMEIIAVVLILIVVIALGVVFRKAIGNLFTSLWEAVSKALKGDNTSTADPGTPGSIGETF